MVRILLGYLVTKNNRSGMAINKLQNEQKAEKLTDAFNIFNELSKNLSVSYQALEKQVVMLREELVSVRSERLKTLMEKEKIANRLQQILKALPAGVVVVDNEGLVNDCNVLATDFLDSPLIGLYWLKVSERSLIDVHDNPHEKKLQNGKFVNISYNALDEESGQIILLSDVSDMRLLQDGLNRQKHLTAMGEMVASMAHQVRTPLSTAILYASQLGKSILDDEKRLLFSEKVLERLHHLERQVNDMLIFAREGRMAMSRFTLSELLAKVSDAMDELAPAAGVQFAMKNDSSVNTMVGNEDALRGALMNLLTNAVEAAPENSKVKLEVVRSGADLLTIIIRDYGSGIREADQERIFEPFYTTRINGTGLGLAVVDSVVRVHGGHIQCQSKQGRGTVFKITLSCDNQEALPLSDDFSDKDSSHREVCHGAL